MPTVIEGDFAPKLSAWWKKEAPGFSVTAFLPALIRSQSSSPAGGDSPKLRMPFSVWKIACRPDGWNLATISGKPMPRLT